MSIIIMNTEKNIEITDVPVATHGPNICDMMNMSDTNTVTMMCPENMLANKRIINTVGFINVPANSTKGMIGIGNFKKTGTSGFMMCIQYERLAVKVVIKNVNTANAIAMEILPVMLNPKGSISPTRLATRMKLKRESR